MCNSVVNKTHILTLALDVQRKPEREACNRGVVFPPTFGSVNIAFVTANREQLRLVLGRTAVCTAGE
jgi:hypothetical protein